MTDTDTPDAPGTGTAARGHGAAWAGRRTQLIVLITASTLLVGSVTAVAVTDGFTHRTGPGAIGRTGMMGATGMMSGTSLMSGNGMMGGTGMMSSTMGPTWLAGDGTAVTSIAAARQRATQAGTRSSLHPGEVIWFDNGFYVELKDATGRSATEVIVDPRTGAVTGEHGPAMMWNTRYGMMPASSAMMAGTGMMGGSATGMMGTNGATSSQQSHAVTSDQARSTAQEWLAANRSGETAQAPDAYPGYYTMETTASGTTVGMLSVNASTGAVWYHTWHGRFIASEDS